MKKVHIGFGFHVNLYHSFREDTNDQKGFASDIKVIRHIIAVLDKYNALGVPVKAVWDFENAFSLEETLPAYAPDIIENVKRRVHENSDEPILMGYNNGALGAMTKDELEASVKWAITNDKSSGILDVFGKYEPVLRPQEIMFTPSQTRSYTELGIKALCFYYSAVPFDGFRTLIPLLPEKYAFNPLNYFYGENRIIVMPTYNNGDLVDFGSLKSLAKKLHNKQKRGEIDTDVFIFINMDADSMFWYGLGFPFPLNKLPNLTGIDGLVGEIASLPFVEFDTPGNYIKTHPALNDITFTHDIADGNFDGYSSWSEKPFNRQIWTRIERARAMKPKQGFEQEAFLKRIRLLSTTHFGLSTPHLNLRREMRALDLSRQMLSLMEPLDDPAHENVCWKGGEIGNIRYCLPSADYIKTDRSAVNMPQIFNAESPRIKYRGSDFCLEKINQQEISYEAANHVLNGMLYEARLNLPDQIEYGSFRYAQYTAEGLDGVYFYLKIQYPYTREDAYVFNEIAALQRTQDDGWIEVYPLEICAGAAKNAKIIKRNYEGDMSSYDLDDFQKADPLNKNLDSFNHQITNGVVGVQTNTGGFLLAVQKQIANSMAVCPMRIRNGNLYLNPFGTYFGKQRHHATHGNGVGAQVAVYSAPQFLPLAPSYNGALEEFLLAIFPFENEPDEKLWKQAIGFCEGSIAHNEIEKDFCVPHKAVDADINANCKKITAGIPLALQAKVMIGGIKSLLGV